MEAPRHMNLPKNERSIENEKCWCRMRISAYQCIECRNFIMCGMQTAMLRHAASVYGMCVRVCFRVVSLLAGGLKRKRTPKS